MAYEKCISHVALQWMWFIWFLTTYKQLLFLKWNGKIYSIFEMLNYRILCICVQCSHFEKKDVKLPELHEYKLSNKFPVLFFYFTTAENECKIWQCMSVRFFVSSISWNSRSLQNCKLLHCYRKRRKTNKQRISRFQLTKSAYESIVFAV